MYATATETRVKQGDIFKELEFQYINEDGSTQSVTFDFWIVLSQDCDLEHDFKAYNHEYENQDKRLQTILVCPAFVSSQLKAGTHMQQIDWNMQVFGRDLWKGISNNNHYRYHLLPSDEESSFPELVIDFKRFFTLPRDYVYSNISKKVMCIEDMFKESLSQRFAYYLSRIALPEEKSE